MSAQDKRQRTARPGGGAAPQNPGLPRRRAVGAVTESLPAEAPSKPDLAFRVEGIPPRKTLQSGRGAYVEAGGKVRFFTRAGVRAEAWEMRAEFARQLPEGWTARGDAAKVRVELVYPLRKQERERLVAAGAVDTLLPHVERPDADNLVKSLLDSMTRAGVWVDDAQVCDLRVRKWRGMRPRWAVFVWWLPAPSLPPLPRGRKAEPQSGQGVLFGSL